MSKVPFVDLLPQYEECKAEIDAAFAEIITKSNFIQGKACGEFESALAASVGTKHAVGLANATSGLWIAMKALGIGPGDEVITTVHTAICTAEGATLCGATPVFVDIDPATYQINPALIEAAITPKTKAIVPVHLYGIPVDLDAIFAIAKKHNLPVIEDSAQAQGAEYKGKRVGCMGVAGIFSFFPSKNLGAFGDAGAICTNDESLARNIRMFSNHGRLEKFTHEIPGANERLDTLHAAVLKIKLPRLDQWNANRRAAADRYAELLGGVEEVTLPQIYPDTVPVWHLYVIRSPHRDGLEKHLKEKGIGVGRHYPLPLHEQPAMRQNYKTGDFPEAEKATREILSIPMYPHLTEEMIQQTVSEIKAYLASAKVAVPVN